MATKVAVQDESLVVTLVFLLSLHRSAFLKERKKIDQIFPIKIKANAISIKDGK